MTIEPAVEQTLGPPLVTLCQRVDCGAFQRDQALVGGLRLAVAARAVGCGKRLRAVDGAVDQRQGVLVPVKPTLLSGRYRQFGRHRELLVGEQDFGHGMVGRHELEHCRALGPLEGGALDHDSRDHGRTADQRHQDGSSGRSWPYVS